MDVALTARGDAVPAVATTVMVALPEARIEATLQLAVVAVVVHGAPAMLKIVPPLTVTPIGTAVAASGPALATVIVNVPF